MSCEHIRAVDKVTMMYRIMLHQIDITGINMMPTYLQTRDTGHSLIIQTTGTGLLNGTFFQIAAHLWMSCPTCGEVVPPVDKQSHPVEK